ncbi:hypothetical protein HMPREF1199_01160 [Hoylesella oralis CC98A]|nr:hypothetical protein HMPREF1199_01160 [Hoylesella oralis CC98A]
MEHACRTGDEYVIAGHYILEKKKYKKVSDYHAMITGLLRVLNN